MIHRVILKIKVARFLLRHGVYAIGLVLNSLRLLELAAEGGNNLIRIVGDVQMEVKPLQSRRIVHHAYRFGRA